MERLYALYRIATEDSLRVLVACSNDVDKLQDIVPEDTWHSHSSTRGKLRSSSTETKYPQYHIYEIPYVC